MGNDNLYLELDMPILPSANSLTKAVFKDDIPTLRQVHSVSYWQAAKYLDNCSCSKCDGIGSGRPSTLHVLEKEIDAAIECAREKAQGGVPDYSNIRQFAAHPLTYFQARIHELGSVGFESEDSKRAMLSKLITEHSDVLLAALNGGSDEETLSQVLENIAVLEDVAAHFRGNIAITRREREVGIGRIPERRRAV